MSKLKQFITGMFKKWNKFHQFSFICCASLVFSKIIIYRIFNLLSEALCNW